MSGKKSMPLNNITFVIFTYNEEKRIEYIIRNFIRYGDVLLLDDGSTDQTKEIAEKMGAKVILRPKSKYVENQEMFDFIKQSVKTDWIFWAYTDNLMPKSLLEKLTEISRQDKIKYVNIPLYTYLWGETRDFMRKEYSPRFFKKEYINFDGCGIHSMGKFSGGKDEILTLPNKEKYAIRHYSSYNLKKFISSHSAYAEVEAMERFNGGRKSNFFRMLVSMARYFLIYAKDGYKSGKLGFFTAISYAFFRFMMFFRLYELERGITIDSIEKNYAKSKEELLREIEKNQ